MENPFYSSSDFTWREHKYKACTESHDHFLFLPKHCQNLLIFGYGAGNCQNSWILAVWFTEYFIFLSDSSRQCANTLLSKLSITNMTLKLFLSFMETCNMFVQITFLSKFSITNVIFDFFLSFMTPTMCFFKVPFSPKLVLQISHFFLHG